MAKEKEATPVTPDLDAPVTVSGADLLNLITMLQNNNAKSIAEAFEKLSPNYKTPEQKAFNEKLRGDQRNIEIFKLKNRKRQQKFCDHEIGQTGRKRLGEGAFNMLKLPTGETIGVCTYCQMVISSANPDHTRFFKKAGGTLAEAGQFNLNDPIKAQLARLGDDERKRVLEARAKHVELSPQDDDEDYL